VQGEYKPVEVIKLKAAKLEKESWDYVASNRPDDSRLAGNGLSNMQIAP
jgi:hypothetical protein